MAEAGATPEETVMIGDSEVDVLTARNAGAWVDRLHLRSGPQTLMDAIHPMSWWIAGGLDGGARPAKIDLRR